MPDAPLLRVGTGVGGVGVETFTVVGAEVPGTAVVGAGDNVILVVDVTFVVGTKVVGTGVGGGVGGVGVAGTGVGGTGVGGTGVGGSGVGGTGVGSSRVFVRVFGTLRTVIVSSANTNKHLFMFVS